MPSIGLCISRWGKSQSTSASDRATGAARLSAISTVIWSSFQSTGRGVSQWQRELSRGCFLASEEIHEGSPRNPGYWRVFMGGEGE